MLIAVTPRHTSLILNQRNFSTAEAHNSTAQDIEKTLNVVRLLLSELQEHFLLRTKLCTHSTETTEIQQLCDSPKVTGNHQNSQGGFSGSRSNQTSPAQCRSPRPCRPSQSAGSNTHCPWPLHCLQPILEPVTAGAHKHN